ncbi:glucosaminidase domain-containing protein, partial [Salinimicrobium oceani]
YIHEFAPIAREEMELYKIPASITLAQGILESGAGDGELTRRANNHFGIKCHGWSGQKVYHDDDASQECFRKYKDPKYSYRDHSLFLTERKRYAALFDLD